MCLLSCFSQATHLYMTARAMPDDLRSTKQTYGISRVTTSGVGKNTNAAAMTVAHHRNRAILPCNSISFRMPLFRGIFGVASLA